MPSIVQFWLCRVVLHKPTGKPIRLNQLNDAAQQTVMARIINGELGTAPNGDIIEPMEAFATEELCREARAKKIVDSPNDDWRVVMTVGER